VPQIRDALAGQISRETYIAYLGEAYHHVRFTVPLMMAAGARLPASKEWLRTALVEYIEEEHGHEEWILNDIAQAGGDADAVRNGQPGLATELMVSYVFDYVSRRNPVGLFGIVYVLEGTSTELATPAAEALMKSLALPKDCFSYLLSHGSLDLEHIAFFEELVNKLDDAEDRRAVLHVCRVVFGLFGDLFRSIPHGTELKNAV